MTTPLEPQREIDISPFLDCRPYAGLSHRDRLRVYGMAKHIWEYASARGFSVEPHDRFIKRITGELGL